MNALLLYWKPLCIVLAIALAGFMGYRAGANAVKVAYEKRDTEAANEYAKAITEANAKLRAAEERSAELLAAADADYQAKLKEHNDAANKTVADIRSGRVSLRIPTCPTAPGGSAVSGVATATGSSDGQDTGDVSKRLAEDVAGRLAKCDEAAIALDLAQQVIISDRK
jgi:hypothetical protein